MVTRIYGIPDANGIIRVSCGTDILEIQIVSPAGGPSGTAPSAGGGAPSGTGGGANPPAGAAPDNPGWNPADLPGTYMRAPRGADGEVDMDGLLREIRLRLADPAQPDPGAVVLSAGGADLHEISRLGREIDAALPDIPLAIDFGGSTGR